MKRRDCLKGLAALSCGAALGFVPAFAEDSKDAPLRLRVLTYNIQIGRGPGGSYSDPAQAFLDRTAKAIAAVDPDVAGLQEVDNKTERSGVDVDQLGELARMTGLTSYFAPKFERPGGLYGIGVLTKEKPIKTDKIIMEGSSHPRALQICEFERYVFFNTHLPLTAELRLKAVRTIDKEAQKYAKPIVLVGDLNAEPDSEEIKELDKTWTRISPDAPTFPADDPNVQIDYVFVKNARQIDVFESRVIDDPSTSDHRPIFCEFAIQ